MTGSQAPLGLRFHVLLCSAQTLNRSSSPNPPHLYVRGSPRSGPGDIVLVTAGVPPAWHAHPFPQVGHGSTENRIETTDQKQRSHFTDGEADTPTGSVGPRQPCEPRVQRPRTSPQAPLHFQWPGCASAHACPLPPSVRSLTGPQRTLRAKVLPCVALQLALTFSSTLGERGGPPQCPGGVRGPCGFLGRSHLVSTHPLLSGGGPIPRAASRRAPLLWNLGEKGCCHLREWCPWQPS